MDGFRSRSNGGSGILGHEIRVDGGGSRDLGSRCGSCDHRSEVADVLCCPDAGDFCPSPSGLS
jgi:hypothetical protein